MGICNSFDLHYFPGIGDERYPLVEDVLVSVRIEFHFPDETDENVMIFTRLENQFRSCHDGMMIRSCPGDASRKDDSGSVLLRLNIKFLSRYLSHSVLL